MKKTCLAMAIAAVLATNAAYAEEAGTKMGDHFAKREARMKQELSKLPADRASLIETSLKSMREERKASFDTMKAKQARVSETLNAATFDKAAYLAAMNDLNSYESDQRAKRAEKMADLAGQLNPDERKVLAKLMERGPRHHGKKNSVKPVSGETTVQ